MHISWLRINILRGGGGGGIKVLKRARICKPFKEPRNRFPAWRAGTTSLFDVPARQATKAGGINSMKSIPGLLERFQIRAQLSDEESLVLAA